MGTATTLLTLQHGGNHPVVRLLPDPGKRGHGDKGVKMAVTALRPLLLGLMLLAGLPACGPASSDNAPSLESRASVGWQDYGPEAMGLARAQA